MEADLVLNRRDIPVIRIPQTALDELKKLCQWLTVVAVKFPNHVVKFEYTNARDKEYFLIKIYSNSNDEYEDFVFLQRGIDFINDQK